MSNFSAFLGRRESRPELRQTGLDRAGCNHLPMGLDLNIFDPDTDIWFTMPDAVVIPRVGEDILLDNVNVEIDGAPRSRIMVRVNMVRYYWDTDRITGVRVIVSVIE